MRLRLGSTLVLTFGALALPCGVACTELVDTDRVQCELDSDCHARGGVFSGLRCMDSVCQADPAWSCVGAVTWPEPAPLAVNVSMQFVDLVSKTPVPDVNVKLCAKLDVDCAQPLQSGLKADATGAVSFQAEAGFNGYVAFDAPDLIPGLYFFYPPIDADRRVPPVPLLALPTLTDLATKAGRPLIADRGHVFLAAYDCEHTLAEGITLSSAQEDAEARSFYFVKGLPTTLATSTDSSGWAGLLNLPAGTTTVTGTLAGPGTRIGTESVLVHAGQVTYTSLVPTPE